MANQGKYIVSLQAAEGAPARDPKVRVDFVRADTNRVIARKRNLKFPPRRRFTLPAFPQVMDMYCYVAPSLYMHRTSDLFMLTDGEIEPETPLRVLRNPKKWQAAFARWRGLPSGFRDLKAILDGSSDLRVRNGPLLGRLTDSAYDDATEAKAVLAKAAMLNIYFKLSSMGPPGSRKKWISFVEEILTIDRERIVARVRAEMADAVREAGNSDDYHGSPAGNHYKYMPKRFSVIRPKMFAIKSEEAKGNLQITLAPATDSSGIPVLLMDADIDENGRLLAHIMDVLKHMFTGGTHPYLVHELLVLEKAELGYGLKARA